MLYTLLHHTPAPSSFWSFGQQNGAEYLRKVKQKRKKKEKGFTDS